MKVARVVDKGNELASVWKEGVRIATVAHPAQLVLNLGRGELDALIGEGGLLFEGVEERLNINRINEEEPVKIEAGVSHRVNGRLDIPTTGHLTKIGISLPFLRRDLSLNEMLI